VPASIFPVVSTAPPCLGAWCEGASTFAGRITPMSAKTDRKRHLEAVANRGKERARWKAALRKARNEWSSKAGRKRRFKEGQDAAAHLSGYWDWVLRRANQIFGGPKP